MPPLYLRKGSFFVQKTGSTTVFDNFTVTAGSFPGSPSETTINLLGQDPTAVAGVQQDLVFTPTVSNAWSNASVGNTSVILGLDFSSVQVGGSKTYGIRQIGITDLTASINSSDAVIMTVLVCFNPATVTTLCTSGAANYTQTVTWNLASGANLTSFGGVFAGGLQTNYNVHIDLTLTDGTSGSNGVQIDSFFIGFMDTPEPSTFAMLGSALVSLAVIGRRRRKV